MTNGPSDPREPIARLVGIMERLRGPDGCPWDREQTTRSLRGYLIEESHEVVEAIDDGDPVALRDELGDLLLQIVFLAQLAREDGHFAFGDVAEAIAEKLVRRHPHVFGEADARSADEAFRHWEAAKARETPDGAPGSRLSGLPRGLPSLLRAHRLADRAARCGFDWPDDASVFAKIDEELGELRAAAAGTDPEQVDEELGDVLFACASLARRLGVDPEGALERANRKFEGRFREVEERAAERDVRLEELDAAQLDGLWREAKDAGNR